MAEASFTVVDPTGLHARPAARFVQVASRFASRIAIHTDAAQADAKSLIGVLSLAVRPGASIRLVADGPDADTALRALADELTPYVAASVDA
jgi:phosphotransferase system HPr (HPr) family protein